jgi:hypothetical protein
VLGDRRGRDSPLTRAPAVCQGIKGSGRGAGEVPRAEGGLKRSGDSIEGPEPSSDAKTRLRGRVPRVRRGVPRCGAHPSSGTEVRLRGTGDGGLAGH